MSVDKSELKLAITHALGCDLEDDLESAERDMLIASGRVQASAALEIEIQKIVHKLDADMESIKRPFKSLEDLTQAKRYLGFTLTACSTVSKQSNDLRLRLEGKTQAFKHTMQRIKRICDAEQRKIDAVKEATKLEGNTSKSRRSRPIGTHPGPSLADRRRAEALKKED